MPPAPLPPNESSRQRALDAYRILDTDRDAAFDDLVKVAAHVCGCPIAMVSLVDGDRQWFKAKVGVDQAETERRHAFCAHAILTPDEVFVVEDTARDPRFSDNPYVTDDPKIRFYLGVPLMSADRHALGTLCVLDRESRQLSAGQMEVMQALARQVERLLEFHHLNGQMAAALQEIRTLEGIVPICAHCSRIRDDEGYWEKVQIFVARKTGARFSHGICPSCMHAAFPKEFDALLESRKAEAARRGAPPEPPPSAE